MTKFNLETMFDYHPAMGDQPGIYGAMRFMCLQLAKFIMNAVPDCMEREEAIKRLNEVMFWANSGVARYRRDAAEAVQKANEIRPLDTSPKEPVKKAP